MKHPKSIGERRTNNDKIIYKRIKEICVIRDLDLTTLNAHFGMFIKRHPFSHKRKSACKFWPKSIWRKYEYYKRDYPEYF